MRSLTKKQKQIIIKWFEEDKLDCTNAEYFDNEEKMLEELEEINDYETLWMDARRYASDLVFNYEMMKEEL